MERERTSGEADSERSLGDVAAGRVRGVLEAAERAAAEIQSTARTDAEARVAAARIEAERIVADARSESAQLLERARSDADGHVAAAREVVEDLVGQAEALLAQVTALGDRVSAAAPNAASGPVAVSATTVGPAAGATAEAASTAGPEPASADEPAAEAEPAPARDPEPAPERDPAPSPAPDPEPGSETEPGAGGEATTTEELIAQLRAASGAAATTPGTDDATPVAVSGSDLGAARLVAMNMALEGASREQIASQLRSEFGPVDGIEGLLDDVFARAGR